MLALTLILSLRLWCTSCAYLCARTEPNNQRNPLTRTGAAQGVHGASRGALHASPRPGILALRPCRSGTVRDSACSGGSRRDLGILGRNRKARVPLLRGRARERPGPELVRPGGEVESRGQLLGDLPLEGRGTLGRGQHGEAGTVRLNRDTRRFHS